ncbi:Protein smg7 [Cichlidogyrus casuarinus]|uniref:Protein smg7 n=1 Tax=Cichlidogyrus casuarinus TaxID=1844966 RepID=A0ABD2Q1G8_9PLAT
MLCPELSNEFEIPDQLASFLSFGLLRASKENKDPREILKFLNSVKSDISYVDPNKNFSQFTQTVDIFKDLLICHPMYVIKHRIEHETWAYWTKELPSKIPTDLLSGKPVYTLNNILWVVAGVYTRLIGHFSILRANNFDDQLLKASDSLDLDTAYLQVNTANILKRLNKLNETKVEREENKPFVPTKILCRASEETREIGLDNEKEDRFEPLTLDKCCYLINFLMIHVGDLNRYLKQPASATKIYQSTASLFPNYGQAYNQLAIMLSSKPSEQRDHLEIARLYAQAAAAQFPFPNAHANLRQLANSLAASTTLFLLNALSRRSEEEEEGLCALAWLCRFICSNFRDFDKKMVPLDSGIVDSFYQCCLQLAMAFQETLSTSQTIASVIFPISLPKFLKGFLPLEEIAAQIAEDAQLNLLDEIKYARF